MSFTQPIWTRRAAGLCMLGAMSSWLIGCARHETLADELQGKFDIPEDVLNTYKQDRWYPTTGGVPPPFYAMVPSLMEHLAGTDRGPGAARMVHPSRKKTFNFAEAEILVGSLLDAAGVEAKFEFDRFG